MTNVGVARSHSRPAACCEGLSGPCTPSAGRLWWPEQGRSSKCKRGTVAARSLLVPQLVLLKRRNGPCTPASRALPSQNEPSSVFSWTHSHPQFADKHALVIRKGTLQDLCPAPSFAALRRGRPAMRKVAKASLAAQLATRKLPRVAHDIIVSTALQCILKKHRHCPSLALAASGGAAFGRSVISACRAAKVSKRALLAALLRGIEVLPVIRDPDCTICLRQTSTANTSRET